MTRSMPTVGSPRSRYAGAVALLVGAAIALPTSSAVAHTGKRGPAAVLNAQAGVRALPPEKPARGLNYEGLEPARSDGPCQGLFELRSNDGRIEGCTHGPDP